MVTFAPFTCPAPTALTAIPNNVCPTNFDQIVELVFQRKQASPSFDTDTIKASATWTSLAAATNSTKIIKTPKLGGIVFPKASPKIEGENDNLYPDGAGVMVAGDPITVTATLTSKGTATQEALDKLMAEGDGLWVYFINRFGTIFSKADFSGFEVLSVGVSDVGSEGLSKPDQFDIIFKLPYGWSRGRTASVPSFDILKF